MTDAHEIRHMNSLQNLSKKRNFRENQSSHSHALAKDVNVFLLAISTINSTLYLTVYKLISSS
jgi:hypothetical protein